MDIKWTDLVPLVSAGLSNISSCLVRLIRTLELKRMSYKNLKMENLAENAFSSFCSIRWKFFKQTPLYSSKISENILFLVLLSEMIIPEVI